MPTLENGKSILKISVAGYAFAFFLLIVFTFLFVEIERSPRLALVRPMEGDHV